MLFKEYDDYKSAVLNALSQNKRLRKAEGALELVYTEKNYPNIRDIDERTSANYVDEDWGKTFKEAKNPHRVIGKTSLLKDDLGNIYGKDLLQYLLDNHLLCGVTSPSTSTALWDNSGEKTLVQPGVFMFGRGGILDSYASSSHYTNDSGYFIIDEVDDDGIIVLPPGCSAVALLDEFLLSKITKIIAFLQDSFTPALFIVQNGWMASDIIKTNIKLVDVSHIEYVIYTHSWGVSVDSYGSYVSRQLKMPNGITAFNFKSVCVNVLDKPYDRDEKAMDLNCYLDNTNIILNLYADINFLGLNTVNKPFITTLNYFGSKALLDVNLSTLEGKTSIVNSNIRLRVRFNTSLIKVSDIENIGVSLNAGDILLLESYKVSIESENDWSRLVTILNDIKSKGVILQGYLKEPTTYYANSTYMGEEYVGDETELYETLAGYYILYAYGHRILTLNNMLAVDSNGALQMWIDKVFGSCDSTCGKLSFKDCYERLCVSDYMEVKEFLVDTGIVVGSIGAGVEISLNLLQIFILRIFGLKCSNFSALTDDSIYGALQLTSNKYSRKSIYGNEVFVCAKKTGQKINTNHTILAFTFGSASAGYSTDLRFKMHKIQGVLKYMFRVDSIFAKKEEYGLRYFNTKKCNWNLGNVNVDIGTMETTNKTMEELVQNIGSYMQRNSVVANLLKTTRNSKSCGLYGGVEVKGLSTKVIKSNNLPANIVMDDIKYDAGYEIYTIERQDTGVELQIEQKTLAKLLDTGALVSTNLDSKLIKGSVVFLRDEFDKYITETMEQLNDANLLMMDTSSNAIPFSKMEFKKIGIGKYSCIFYNIGEEVLLPSFIHYAEQVGAYKSKIENQGGVYTETTKIGIEVGNDEPVDVTERIKGLLGDIEKKDIRSDVGTKSIARQKGIEFYCSENAYYKDKKPLTIWSPIVNKLLELPRGVEIDFCYNYSSHGLPNVLLVDTKIVVRPNSVIYNITTATELDIADNCTIAENAFAGSRLKKLIMHGGELPSYACYKSNNLEELVIDGGTVRINVSAFIGCSNFKGITCINGGNYILLDSDNAVIIRALEEEIRQNSSKGNVFYTELFNEYNNKNKEEQECLDVIPYAINDDYTITLKHKDGKESKLAITRICNMLDRDLLNFRHELTGGQIFDFVETLKYSGYRCIKFVPGINNTFCSCKVLVLLDMEELSDNTYLEDRHVIFAYQKEDWTQGKIQEVPKEYLSKLEAGIFFDDINATYSVNNESAVCFHFWQNLSYYTDRMWRDFKEYYTTTYSRRPDEYNYYADHTIFSKLYLPASHEYAWNYKKQDATGEGKDTVVFGSYSKYAKRMHQKRYNPPLGHEVNIIPGISENCMFELKPILLSESEHYGKFIWSECRTLNVYTPTKFNNGCCLYAESYLTSSIVLKSYIMNVNIYAPVYMHCLAIPFKELSLYSTLIIDCNSIYTEQRVWKEIVSNPYISFKSKDAKIQVINLNTDVLKFLLDVCNYAYAIQLLVNSVDYDVLKDTPEGKAVLAKEDANYVKKDAKNNKYRDMTPNLAYTVHAIPYPKSKYNKETIFDDLDTSEDEEVSQEDKIQEALNTGVIPDMITLDYIDNKGIGELNSELMNSYLGEEDTETDFSKLDFVLPENKAASALVEMCNVDVKAVQEKYDKELSEKEKKEQELKELQYEVEREEAKQQQEGLLSAIQAQDDDMRQQQEAVYTQVTNEVRQKVKENLRKSYEQEEPLKTDIIDKAEVDKNTDKLGTNDTLPEVVGDMFRASDYGKVEKGFAGMLKDDVMLSMQPTTISKRIVLSVGKEIYKGETVIGYEVFNENTQETKRIASENIKKLCLNLKYKVVGITYDRSSNLLVR